MVNIKYHLLRGNQALLEMRGIWVPIEFITGDIYYVIPMFPSKALRSLRWLWLPKKFEQYGMDQPKNCVRRSGVNSDFIINKF